VEIVLVPHCCFSLGARRLERSGNVLNVVGIAGDEGDHPFGPKCRDDAACAAAPIEPTDHRLGDPERIEQRQEIASECRLLARAQCVAREKARRTVTAQIGNDHARAGRCKARRSLGKGMRIVRKTMAHHARPAITRPGHHVGHLEASGLDRLEFHDPNSVHFGRRVSGATFPLSERVATITELEAILNSSLAPSDRLRTTG
jgi:hypothetical protein